MNDNNNQFKKVSVWWFVACCNSQCNLYVVLCPLVHRSLQNIVRASACVCIKTFVFALLRLQ